MVDVEGKLVEFGGNGVSHWDKIKKKMFVFTLSASLCLVLSVSLFLSFSPFPLPRRFIPCYNKRSFYGS